MSFRDKLQRPIIAKSATSRVSDDQFRQTLADEAWMQFDLHLHQWCSRMGIAEAPHVTMMIDNYTPARGENENAHLLATFRFEVVKFSFIGNVSILGVPGTNDLHVAPIRISIFGGKLNEDSIETPEALARSIQLIERNRATADPPQWRRSYK